MIDVVIGRSKSDRAKFGKKGTVLIGRMYVRIGQRVSLSNPVYMDMTSSHVVFIVGKRGSGKSYTMGVVVEGFSLLPEQIRRNVSVIMLDTMGVYWTMKYPNITQEDMLVPYGLKPKGLDVDVYVPYLYFDKVRREGMPADYAFSIDPSELSPDDWAMAFKRNLYTPEGTLIAKAVFELKKKFKTYSIQDMISFVKKDTESQGYVKQAVINMLQMADSWGLFKSPGSKLSSIAKGGRISVIDLSVYATMPGGWAIKALVAGLISQHMFTERMKFRRGEEFNEINRIQSYFSSTSAWKQQFPLVWLVIDEAHEFMPKNEKDKNAATEPLKIILREGRQPGVSLILATQQPGKIHTDVMTQSDIVIGHRVTANLDTEALALLAQSYMRGGIVDAMNNLPREKGSAVLFDDTNERLYAIRMRPRISWHGGSSPSAIKEEKKGI